MRTALVTGVSRRRGIGAAVCRALIADGWSVRASGWPGYDHGARWYEPALDDPPGLIDELSSSSAFAWRPQDLSEEEGAHRLFEWAVEARGAPDSLVVAHAHSSSGGLNLVSADELDRHLRVNARATVLLIAEFARRWRGAAGTGRVVTLTSGPPLIGEVAYAASKGAVAWATLSAAAELSPRGITVNAVDPGPTDTGWLTPDARAKIKSTSPLGGVGSPEEVAEVVRFLLSPAGRAISGQLLTCDGGRRALRP